MIKKTPKIEDKKEINVEPLKIEEIKVHIKGLTPLLMEKMSDKISQSLIDKMQGKGGDKNKIKDFGAEVEDKIHRTESGKVGIPAIAFKKAMVESAPYLESANKKLINSVIVVGDIIQIKYSGDMVVHKTMGRDSGMNKSPRPIWRPMFNDWSCELLIRYNSSLITSDMIVNLLKLAGFHIGVLGWRPSCGGSFGTFTIA